ncbi:hypothetical protein KAFR_0A03230 [Kazachstania africana CBS 2517]|uniref:JmjC domain-containing protein n=1 Tax=Kazachstania africana (strain ATCC 22294 / BCRC 22015 / CBS 2517 / CECT 1963 / NBRC 1671 / NRRL Y-8276) TaxID=1071382 RepID=H2AN08_KAZAF|nr:hypothetical protein KAFR_0A03230 [Kazachstania africana CBS 2517]CCF55758.1 hypothetical protein KAFR_0A03230 [Kazachstania africana CBS 2517]
MLEIPTVYPTKEEFDHPLDYLSQPRIKRLGKNFGMIKLIPPQIVDNLSIDVKTFRFNVRLQHLSQLQIVNRCRLLFFKQLNNFNLSKKKKLVPYCYVTTDVTNQRLFLYDIFIEVLRFYSNDDNLVYRDIKHIVSDAALWRHLMKKFQVNVHPIFEAYLNDYYVYLTQNRYIIPDIYPKSLLEGPDSQDDSSEDGEDDEYCLVCHHDSHLIMCDSCGKWFHSYCTRISNGICQNCIIGNGYYGFRVEKEQYMIDEFEKLFCSDDVETPDIPKLENEFWSIVNNIDNNKIVRYGADLQMRNTKVSSMHPMNLSNLPTCAESLFNNLSTKNISGMTIPWLYVGSKFSTFCWHVEDQYTYSINYQYKGCSKVWYSIPEFYKEKFERQLRKRAPDLFVKQPDLMHQLISLISPYELEQIPVFKAIQNPNEYIITFPKCYHSGFNTGFNLNEAVNFITEDWLKYGIQSINDYKITKKQSIFDCFELVINILREFSYDATNTHNVSFVRSCYSSLLTVYNKNLRMSRKILSLLETSVLVSNFDDLGITDDYIFCSSCGTICSWSFVLHNKNSANDLSPNKKRRVITMDTSNIAKGEVYCLEDYSKMLERDPLLLHPYDKLYYSKAFREVSQLLKQSGTKLDKM